MSDKNCVLAVFDLKNGLRKQLRGRETADGWSGFDQLGNPLQRSPAWLGICLRQESNFRVLDKGNGIVLSSQDTLDH